MEELKVGEYGRTNLGKIIKFVWFEEEKGVICTNKVVLVDEMLKSSRPFYYFEKNELIKNHSKNIIDLIEERRLCEWKICLFCWYCYWKFTNNKSYRRNIYT